MSERVKGSTGVSLEFRLTDATTGAAKAAVDVTTLKFQYHRPGAAASSATSLTLLAAQTTAWAAYGAKEVDGTNSPGVYRIDCPDAAFAAGADEVTLTITGAAIQPATRLIDLTATNTRNANGGLTNLDVAVSSRSTYAGGAVASVTGTVGSVVGGVTVDLNNDKTGYSVSSVTDKAGYSLNLGQTGLSPRLLNTVADSALTVGDALVCAIVAASGQQTVVDRTYTAYTPFTATPVRVWAIDSATTPTSRI